MQAAANADAASKAVQDAPQWVPPVVCFTTRGHAPLAVGSEARSVLRRERDVVDRLNEDKQVCLKNYKEYGAYKAGTTK